jgi:hypothetical protein
MRQDESSGSPASTTDGLEASVLSVERQPGFHVDAIVLTMVIVGHRNVAKDGITELM